MDGSVEAVGIIEKQVCHAPKRLDTPLGGAALERVFELENERLLHDHFGHVQLPIAGALGTTYLWLRNRRYAYNDKKI
jgi:hypothetical protein